MFLKLSEIAQTRDVSRRLLGGSFVKLLNSRSKWGATILTQGGLPNKLKQNHHAKMLGMLVQPIVRLYFLKAKPKA